MEELSFFALTAELQLHSIAESKTHRSIEYRCVKRRYQISNIFTLVMEFFFCRRQYLYLAYKCLCNTIIITGKFSFQIVIIVSKVKLYFFELVCIKKGYSVINILEVYSKSWKTEFKRTRNRSYSSKRDIW